MDDTHRGACLSGREMPWKTRHPHKLLLPWPMFEVDGTPRNPRPPTSGTPAVGYRECWGRVRSKMEPPTELTYQATGVPPNQVPDLTVCPNGPEREFDVGLNCNFGPNFTSHGGIGYPSTRYYVPTEPEPRVRKKPACGKHCACCPCASFCFALSGFYAPLYEGFFPPLTLLGEMLFPGVPRRLCTTGPPILFGDLLTDGYGWVYEWPGDPCGEGSVSGTLSGSGDTYRLKLSSAIIFAPNIFYPDDCYVTILYTWVGVWTTPGGVCDGCVCVDGELDDACDNPNCSFSVTGLLSFGINSCPAPDDPNPQVADLTSELILNYQGPGTRAFGNPTSGTGGLCCAPCPGIDPDVDW